MKNSLINFFFFIIIAFFFSACSIPFLNAQGNAGLSIKSTPKATVFLDGKYLGATPFFDEKIKPGDYTLKLIPESGVGNTWESQIKLVPGVMTVVSRELGETFETSSGYVLSMEKATQKDQTNLLVVTIPDGAIVSVDGEPKDFSPITVDNVSPADHTILVSSPGYIDKSFNTNLIQGYKLTASVQLAKNTALIQQENKIATESGKIITDKEEEDTLKPTEEETKETVGADLKPPYVLVQETPTGWLNVRKEANTKEDNIIKKIYPGDKYKYLDSNESGWYQIELDTEEKGWVSAKYVKLIED